MSSNSFSKMWYLRAFTFKQDWAVMLAVSYLAHLAHLLKGLYILPVFFLHLARSANLPTSLYILPSVITFFL